MCRERRPLRPLLLIVLSLVALGGCLGPRWAEFDMQAYNERVISGEQEMILYNIGRLQNNLPPHFMMLTEVDPTHTFSGTASFQWSQIWQVLLIPFVKLAAINNGNATQKGTNGYQTAATGTIQESPTFRFQPIQGNDFAMRFESPLTDKFALFLEDEQYSGTRGEFRLLGLLFFQSLLIIHGNNGNCHEGLYMNDFRRESNPSEHIYTGQDFIDCLNQIMDNSWDREMIDANHQISTKASADPAAADLVTALQQNYKWTKNGTDFVLVNPLKMFAMFDYDVASEGKVEDAAPTPTPTPDPITGALKQTLSPMFWAQPAPSPDWKKLAYTLPPKYKWKINTTPNSPPSQRYVLVPDDYDLVTGTHGLTLQPAGVESPIKSQPSYSDEIVANVWPYPANYVYVEERVPHPNATATPTSTPTAAPNQLLSLNPFNAVPSPIPTVEERTVVGQQLVQPASIAKSATPPIFDKDVKELCYPDPSRDGSKTGGDKAQHVLCGYAKVGDLLDIMQRLANQACHTADGSAGLGCEHSFFSIGPNKPSFAVASADINLGPEYLGLATEREEIWVPAHNPHDRDPLQAARGRRDLIEFSLLYKLYQMSLVDTSKLANGSIPFTISK